MPKLNYATVVAWIASAPAVFGLEVNPRALADATDPTGDDYSDGSPITQRCPPSAPVSGERPIRVTEA